MTVLEEGGIIVGLVQPREAEINGLWVAPERQGTGAGTLLLRVGEQAIHDAMDVRTFHRHHAAQLVL